MTFNFFDPASLERLKWTELDRDKALPALQARQRLVRIAGNSYAAEEAVLAAGLEPDLRAFHPHLTLARCRDVSPQSSRSFLKAHTNFDAGMIHVESFCLNSSDLTPAGSVYTPELIIPGG